ncbi:MAG: endopeptidase La [Elusimicrobia bacterium RIFCSPLOWO2_01_FULL_59_12]|nr:MAG: endopeptidase La [Elusimicrobia bacterium RIFCSPLOWO2_01_FULL_59_12]
MILSDKTSPPALQTRATLPLLPVRDIVVFPHMMLPLAIGREKSIRALEEAMASHRRIFLAAQKRDHLEEPQQDDIYEIGTVADILQLLKMPDGTLKILVEGRSRGRILQFIPRTEPRYMEVEIEELNETCELAPEIEALQRQCVQLFEQFVKLDRRVPLDTVSAVNAIESPARQSDVIAGNLLIKLSEKQGLLEISEPKARMERLVEILTNEIQILNIQKRIDTRVRTQIEKTQKEYYLNEQMKAIQKELRQKDDQAKDLDDLREKIRAAKMSKEAGEAAEKEVSRLEKMMPFSPEATVVRTYLEWLVNLPWSVSTQDTLDVKRAQATLDEDHYGLEKPKERVLEYLAVLKLVKKIKGPILCFVGPPGVGKTSIARSIANALGRTFVKMSLGGVRDEAEIRGHRRTYIGSLPGRLIRCLCKAKSKNPVFLLDEVDKMGMDWRGDPAAALLEVLDPEQNRTFVDHFLDVEFDLSEVLFICTANSLESIPPSLKDRLEIIRFSGYTEEEKFLIAQKYLILKQMKENGITPERVSISDAAIRLIIRDYTREAGVRSLERQMASLCRKAAKVLVSETVELPYLITDRTVGKLLGIPEFSKDRAAVNTVGVSTGLAWTEHGGELLGIEVVEMPGKGKLLLTGKLGEVMQESAQAALSFIRANAKKWQINSKLFKNRDYHIHVPEGAIPKDGPSAGIAMATALISAMTGRAVKKNIAMTGEITLHGRVLPIGGLKEKSIAAYREGMSTVLFPEGNRKDLGEIPDDIKKHLKMIPLKHMDEVWSIALERTHG